jgi:hypothetical protein
MSDVDIPEIEVSDLSDHQLAEALCFIVGRLSNVMDGLGGNTHYLEREIDNAVDWLRFNDCRNGLDQLASVLLRGSGQPRQVVSYQY